MALRSRARRGEPRSPARRHAAGNPGDTGGYASGRRHCRSGPNRLVCRTVPAVPGTADLRIVAPIREHEGGPVRVASIYDAVADSRTALRLRVTQRRTDLVLVSDSGGGALRPGCLWPRAHAVISTGCVRSRPSGAVRQRPVAISKAITCEWGRGARSPECANAGARQWDSRACTDSGWPPVAEPSLSHSLRSTSPRTVSAIAGPTTHQGRGVATERPEQPDRPGRSGYDAAGRSGSTRPAAGRERLAQRSAVTVGCRPS